jgi:hypothetical protein
MIREKAGGGSDQPGAAGERAGVLIISAGTDDQGEAVKLELTRRRLPVWRWDLPAFPRRSPLSIHLDPQAVNVVGGVLRTADGDLSLDVVKSVWLRRTLSGLIDFEDRPDDIAIFVRLELEAAFRGLADVLRRAFWVNPPRALYAMESGIMQLQAAVAAGLTVPRTLVTTDAGQARGFYDAVGGRVIVKPLAGRGVHRAPPDLLDRIARARSAPCYLQEELLGEAAVNVLIIGRQIVAAESRAPATPYRPYELPPSAAAACLRLLHARGLVFGAVEMIRRPDGEHVFLSYDANPDWLWLERMTGQPLTSAFADLLDEGLR